ncbi:hypothetical protein JW823_00835 [bacterium]|nr:hypothetical protein [candidate division CSSED10-310 bacterium]
MPLINKPGRWFLKISCLWIGISSILMGCARFNRYQIHSEYRFIRAAAKIKTSSRIVSSMVTVIVHKDHTIRIEMSDPVGIARGYILVDSREISLVDLSAGCGRRIHAWIGKLANVCGVPITYPRITEWILPSKWPQSPVTYRIARKDHLQMEILQIPPCDETPGRIVIRLPQKEMEVILSWLEDVEVSEPLSELPAPALQWNECNGQSFPLTDVKQ